MDRRSCIVLVVFDEACDGGLRAFLASERPSAELILCRGRDAFLTTIERERVDCVIAHDHDPKGVRAAVLAEASHFLGGGPQDASVPVVVIGDDAADIAAPLIVECVASSEAMKPGVLWDRIDEATAEAWRRFESDRRRLGRPRGRLSTSDMDPLTGLHSHAYAQRRLGGRFRNRPPGRTMTALIDLDHFEDVNGAFGAATGDGVLTTVASLLSEHVRSEGFVARWTGASFFVVRSCPDEVEARLWGESVRAGISSSRHPDAASVRITSSVGYVCLPSPEMNGEVVAEAEAALALAKSLGRNACCGAEDVRVHEEARAVCGDASLTPELRVSALLARHPLVQARADACGRLASRVSSIMGLSPASAGRASLAARASNLGRASLPDSFHVRSGAYAPLEMRLLDRLAWFSTALTRQLGVSPDVSRVVESHRRPDALSSESDRELGWVVSAVDLWQDLSPACGVTSSRAAASIPERLSLLEGRTDAPLPREVQSALRAALTTRASSAA